jgi:hypothetical protein
MKLLAHISIRSAVFRNILGPLIPQGTIRVVPIAKDVGCRGKDGSGKGNPAKVRSRQHLLQEPTHFTECQTSKHHPPMEIGATSPALGFPP